MYNNPIHDTRKIRQRLLRRLDKELALLPDGWDGEGSFAFSLPVIENARKLIDTFPLEVLLFIDDEDALMPMSSGRLTLDWYDVHDNTRIISIEIAQNGCGAYIRRKNLPTVYCNRFEPDKIPDEMRELMFEYIKN